MANAITLDQLSKNLNREALDAFVLALGCDSYIADHEVQFWDEQSRLYSANQKNGLIPGEAAAALLLCREDVAGRMTLETPAPTVSRWTFGNRSTPVEKATRVTADTIKEIADHVRESSAVKFDDFGGVVCDVDQRAPRMAEVADFMMKTLPELDAVKNCACVGVGCGFVGSANDVVMLAVAAAQATKMEKPVFVLWMSEPVERAAVVVLPGKKIDG